MGYQIRVGRGKTCLLSSRLMKNSVGKFLVYIGYATYISIQSWHVYVTQHTIHNY